MDTEYDFIDKNIIIDNSRNIFSDIYKINTKSVIFTIKEIEHDDLELLKTQLKSNFVTPSIYNAIIHYTHIRSYAITIDGTDIIQLNIISKTTSIKKSELRDIISVIRFFRELDIQFPKIALKINIWMSHFKKMLPRDNIRILTPENVNTGFTMYKKSDISKREYDIKEIHLFRKEELHKVLIHEMIHAYDLDTYFIHNHQKVSDRLEDRYNIKSRYGIKIYESYVETIAIILHCIYVSQSSRIDVYKAIVLETKWSLFQTAKILNYYNIHSIAELKNSDSNSANIQETSSIFSYYIIKSALLLNIKDFLKMCHTYNTNYIQTKKNWIKKFGKLIENSLDKKSFVDIIDNTIAYIIDIDKNIKNKKYNNIKNNKKYKNDVLKNLKMSLL